MLGRDYDILHKRSVGMIMMMKRIGALPCTPSKAKGSEQSKKESMLKTGIAFHFSGFLKNVSPPEFSASSFFPFRPVWD
jgi:hypothetical protein